MRDLHLLYELVIRDLKIRYRRSVLGILWTVLNPLLMMVILWFVFANLFKFEIENYAVYILCGQVIFQFFQTSTTEAMSAIISNGGLIRKIYIPKYIFVLSKIMSGAVNMAASVIALFIVMLLTKTEVHLTILLAFIPLSFLILLSLGAGFLLAALAVKFRDVVHLYGVFCTALFYLTPIIYPMSILPDNIKKIVLMNPMTVIINIFRQYVLYGKAVEAADIAMAGCISMIVFFFGYGVFRMRENSFIFDI